MDSASTAAEVSAALAQSVPGGFAIGDFWSLTQQAGPLRWPIFFVLALGLFLVFVKLYELVRDRRVSKGLQGVDLSSVSLKEVTRLVSNQEESMLSSLWSTMLNVFQTRPGEGLLHDEISNFVAFQNDQFAVFRRRMEFLSDTAGALGLMGTVWGMFTVFFQGTAQQDVILRGMGIALITTLLGLVVSIILNFATTELGTVFNKRIEQVSTKSDELRFRLMELAPRFGEPGYAPAYGSAAASQGAGGHGAAAGGGAAAKPSPGAPAGKAPGPTSASSKGDAASGAPSSTVAASTPAAPEPKWRYVEVDDAPAEVTAGAEVTDLRVVVKNGGGKPAPGVPVVVSVASPAGSLNGGSRQFRTDSDAAGRVALVCNVPEKVGPFALSIALPEQPGPPTRLDLLVRPGKPERVEVEGNHQAAVAGMRLPAPLAVRVYDRFDNPVPDVEVGFKVKQGAGRLAGGKSEVRASTDASGRASTSFVVSGEAGQNVVAAVVQGAKGGFDFVAFGTEV